jgi:1-deoxy-D-xylulose-5-phosphate reductoisomerase
LTFFAPDEELFPATRIAREALLHGGTAPGILNAANEVAVAAFLSGHLPFTGIPVVVERTLEVAVEAAAPASLAEVLEMDRHGRAKASEILGRM